ncbi:MAG: 5-formyltetrahydrofolate cyclo-ligase [Faecalibacterium sp.]|nr:5-formyltetrahydrofolate cyclo-ligase [Faecalibacterium sp.]
MIEAVTKPEQRAAGKAARAALCPATRRQASAAICAQLQSLPALRAAKTVFCYHAVPPEADPAAVCAWLKARGVRLAYPRCAEKGRMEAWLPLDDAPFTPDVYGIPSPDPAHSRLVPPTELDAVLVPLAAFDAAGGRVGLGAGVYDRYLPHCPQAAKIGVAFGAQQLRRADCAAHDVRLDAVVTEDGIIYSCEVRAKGV